MNTPIQWALPSGSLQRSTAADGIRILAGPAGGKLSAAHCPDFSAARYVVLELTNLQTEQLEFHLEFHSGCDTAGSPTFNCTMGIVPYNRVTVYFDLAYLANQEIFLPRTPGKLKTLVSGTTLPKEAIQGFALRIREHYQSQSFVLHTAYLSDSKPDCTLQNPVKLADPLGQLAVRDWPCKTQSEAEMIDRLHRHLSSVQEGYPEDYPFSSYGGYREKRLNATGFFRVEKETDRWWLVDPEGYVFFSTGFDCMGTNSSDRINGIEDLYEWLPPQDGPFAPAYSERSGTRFTAGRFFDFYIANYIRAFGGNWWESWAKISKSQLYAWGINTIGNWSQDRFIQWAQMPYVYPLADFPTTESCIFRDFPDVFSAEYRQNSDQYARQLEAFREDPLLIGYFMRNEPIWGFAGQINLAWEMFRSDVPFSSKQEFLRWMSEAYGGDLPRLNEAWGTELQNFSGIGAMAYEDFNAAAQADLCRFSARMVREYISVPALALRKADPNHLNLGMRYAWISSDLVFEGCEHFDVFSINCYKMMPDAQEIDAITKRTGRPCMIGEYHFGAPDRGLMAAGLRTVRTQEDRAIAYRYYTEQAAAMKALVGVHYFTQNDEPVLGRADGEAWQIGAVDVCGRVYAEFIDGLAAAHKNLYRVASGEQPPYSILADEIPRIAY